MSYGYDSSSYHGMGAPPSAASIYNTLYDSANEATSVSPGASSSSPSGAGSSSPSKHKRLASLDVVRH